MNYEGGISLGDWIALLSVEPVSKMCGVGLVNPHSYRGYYECLAFEMRREVSTATMLSAAQEADGATYGGWKGGDFGMGLHTEVYVVIGPGHTGHALTPYLANRLLGYDVEPHLPWAYLLEDFNG